MKKTILSLALLSIVTFVKAQDASISHASWPTTAVLPEAHDWSIGFDVVPVITTVGNLFHNPSGNDSIFSQEQFTLVGLYMKDDRTAYRVKVRIAFGSQKYNNLVTDDANTTTQLTDTWTDTQMKITLGFGIQKSRGKGRLRCIYGWEADVMLGTHTDAFTYGNPFSENDQTPMTTDFTQPQAGGGFATRDTSARITSANDGFIFGLQLNAFVGVEYFFAPKISLSAEYGWGLSYGSIGEATASVDGWTGGSGGSESTSQFKLGSAYAYTVDVNNAASIILHFYF